MMHKCPSCKKNIAREDNRRIKKGVMIPLAGARITQNIGEAPRIKCLCGKVIILLKGSL